ncbi:MAG: indolepyruvate ferredoxin oxidoreductase [Verrucomicrobiales bacterium]|jgi:indolepyruvate ferredoxin oxidoreductase
MTTTDFSLTDRMSATNGMITLSGTQALLRIPVDQQRVDLSRGLNTATLISGYRGSPLGGIEGVIAQHKDVLDAANVQFISGVNEDLAATVVWGSQMAQREASAKYDGVKGIWYGKGPGVDRTGDAFRHANFAGVGRYGGVLALAGDDPECKSSTIPSASEFALQDLGMPVFYPVDVADVLRLGRYGFELSRASGLWVGMKIHTDVADGFATIPASVANVEIVDYVHEVDGQPWRATVDNNLIAPQSLYLEEELFGVRQEAALGFVRENPIDRSFGSTKAWLGIVVAGKPLGDVRDALRTLGIDDQLEELGIAIYTPGVISPLEPQGLRAFAEGLDTIFVVEAKRAFIETQVRDVLYDEPNAPKVFGKRDAERDRLLPVSGALSAEKLIEPLRRVLELRIDPGRLAKRRERIQLLPAGDLPSRSPYYCSGCPHNRSTVVPEGSIAAGGIGCHSMVLYMDRDTDGLTQMGGEGAQWVGTAPFVDDAHRFQNLGDGTFFHSGSLAIRQAVAADTDITFKLLYNGVVAMTGGQAAAGEMPVPELTRWLDAEGVNAIVVVTDDVDKYPKNATFAKGCRVVDREQLDDVQRQLRDIPGVTALVYDQGCAADLRRNRKRGTVITPTTRVMINEAICEGCGDCGDVSNCMSVHPVDTPFGRKTQIHQESCNFDLTCLGGNCPAFVTVEIDPDDSVAKTRAGADFADDTVPGEPDLPDEATLLIVGIGGTGVVTASQVLSTAAMLDGRIATSLDQTGLAQKGGQVISNLHLSGTSHEGAAKVGTGAADTMLLFDVLGGSTPAVLERADADKTTAIVSTSKVPTGQMVTNLSLEKFPEVEKFRERINSVTNAETNVWLDAESIARHVFASQPAANMLMVGVAFQLGRIPIASEAIERAIELNGVAVDVNRGAFRLGRRIAIDGELASELTRSAAVAAPEPPAASPFTNEMLDRIPEIDDALDIVLRWRIPELVAWGDEDDARRYVDSIVAVRRSELVAKVDGTPLSSVAARYLFKLMAYKDEYEIARLALNADMETTARARFGRNAKVSYQLKPPSLKKVGIDRKVAIPSGAARKTFASLIKTKRLRGSKFDPFGRSEERKIERQLIEEYDDLLTRLHSGLTAENVAEAVDIAELADQIRGFDEVKLANVERYRSEVAARLEARGH